MRWEVTRWWGGDRSCGEIQDEVITYGGYEVGRR